MDKVVVCEECGGVLAKDDLFCGECGALRAPGAQAPPAAGEPPDPEPSAPPAARPPVSPEGRWRAAFIILVVLGIITCFVALAAFLIVGATPSEFTTPQEDWILSAVCCLLPVGGAGIAFISAGVVVRYRSLRKREGS
jgi:hypothetical protein